MLLLFFYSLIFIFLIYLFQQDPDNSMLSLGKECSDTKVQKIQYILANRAAAKLWEKYPHESRLLEINIAATDSTWRRKGIMNQLVLATEYEFYLYY